MRNLLTEEDLRPLARRLTRTLTETAALLSDIKSFGQFENTRQSTLLEFKAIAAPRWGPAEGKDLLSMWRDYAGAIKRARLKAVTSERASSPTNAAPINSPIKRRSRHQRRQQLRRNSRQTGMEQFNSRRPEVWMIGLDGKKLPKINWLGSTPWDLRTLITPTLIATLTRLWTCTINGRQTTGTHIVVC